MDWLSLLKLKKTHMKKVLLSVLTIGFISAGVSAQNVTIPDAIFKAYLVGNTAINTNADTEIQISEATAFTGQITCWAQGISDLTGIESFTSLTELACSNNSLTSLDVTQNTALTSLWCNGNSLTSLDVTQNTALTSLRCELNSITSLDVSQNTALTLLECNNNQLGGLDISTLTALTDLDCGSNFLSDLNIANNPLIENVVGQNNFIDTFTKGTNNSLVYLYLANNSLNSIDISNLPALYVVSVLNNSLTSMDVSNCDNLGNINVENNSLTSLDLTTTTALESLICTDNLMTSIDVSFLPYLGELLCEDNNLTSINIQNGNNSAIATNYFKSTGNPSLTCIQVDDVAYSTTNWTNIDAGASFSLDCNGGLGIDELKSITMNVYPNPASSQITVDTDEQIESVMVFDLFGSLVQQEFKTSFSIEALSSGVYIAHVRTNTGISRIRFVKK